MLFSPERTRVHRRTKLKGLADEVRAVSVLLQATRTDLVNAGLINGGAARTD